MTHPVTGGPDEVVDLVRRVAMLDDAIAASREVLDDLARQVLAVRPGVEIPRTLRDLVRFTVERLDALHAARAMTDDYLRSVAHVAETVPVRVGSVGTLTDP